MLDNLGTKRKLIFSVKTKIKKQSRLLFKADSPK